MDSMEKESRRLDSFAFWPLDSPVRPRELARAGFYYTGFADRVKCAFCHGEHEQWKNENVPVVEHQRRFPSCKFAMGLSTNNVQDGGRWFPNRTRDVPTHPNYKDETDRIRSFRNWPEGKTVTPLDFARAGFFYTGFGDSVRCFFCGVGLKNWEEGEDPWAEHVRWRGCCQHINSESAKKIYHTDRTNSFWRNDYRTDGIISFPATCTEEQAFPQYHNVDRRMTSFQTMQLAIVNPKSLAVAGFFFQPETHTARCFCCAMVLTPMNWNQHNLFAVHERESPNCQHISNLPNTCLDFGLELDQNLPRDQVQKLLLHVTEPITDDNTDTNQSNVTSREGFLADGNRMLKEQQCKICKGESASVVFLPCGHLVSCTGCSTLYRECRVCCSQVWARVKSSRE